MDKSVSGKPYFSIVMPTYGVERYIEKAIKSIQCQTFENWEIIVVDDCTKDKSIEIAHELSLRDKRIFIVHHESNQGLSAARNTGTQAANGKYIWYMDPDDWVDEDLLEKVFNSVAKNPAQLIIFGLEEEYYDKQGSLNYTHKLIPEENYFADKGELRPNIIKMEQQTLYGYAWNKFYLLDYLREKGFYYENVKLIEDIVFNIKYTMDIDTMNVLSICPYHYGKRMETNLTNKFVADYFKLHRRRIEMLYKQFLYWDVLTEDVKSVLGSLYARYILSALERNCGKKSKMGFKGRKTWCRSLFRDDLFDKLILVSKASDSRILAMWLNLLKRKKVFWCLLWGRGVYIARNGLPMLYTKIKSER